MNLKELKKDIETRLKFCQDLRIATETDGVLLGIKQTVEAVVKDFDCNPLGKEERELWKEIKELLKQPK